MNSLKQQESLLIGSTESIERLSQQDSASILTVSDSHGSWKTLAFILQQWGQFSDALVFCGDGATDIAQILTMAKQDPSFCQNLPPVIAFVRGNNDYDQLPVHNFQKPWDAEDTERLSLKVPLHQTLTAAGHKIFVTHGHRYSLYSGGASLVEASSCHNPDLILFGHTHVASHQTHSANITLVNPGSCSRPRNLQPPTFARISLVKNQSLPAISYFHFNPSKSIPFFGAQELPLL